LLEKKREAVHYYNENQIPKEIENLLNAMFENRPEDLYGYMSNFFGNLSKAVIIKELDSYTVISPSGSENLKTTVYCCVNGEKKVCCQLDLFQDNRPYKEKITLKTSSVKAPNSKKESKNKMHKKEQLSAEVSIASQTPAPGVKSSHVLSYKTFASIVQHDLIPIVQDIELDDQDKLDEKLNFFIQEALERSMIQERCLSTTVSTVVEAISEPSSTKESVTTKDSQDSDTTSSVIVEKFVSEENEMFKTELTRSTFFVSLLVMYTSSCVKNESFYKTLDRNFNKGKQSINYQLPLPAMSMICCDISSPGKLNLFKNVMLLPKPNADIKKTSILLSAIYHHIEDSIKSQVSKTSNGLLLLSMERGEQVFDLIATTVKNHLQVEWNDTFDMILDISADDLYDEEKKKYEVSMGVQKTGYDLVAMYKHWIEVYPIVGLIDPIAVKDDSNQGALYSELSDYCFIMTSRHVTSNDQTILGSTGDMTTQNVKHSNGMVLQPEACCQTITELNQFVANTKEGGDVFLMTDDWCSAQTIPLAVDMSIACGSKFLQIASPSAWGSTSITRWIDICTELEKENTIAYLDSYGFKERVEENILEGDLEQENQNDGEQR